MEVAGQVEEGGVHAQGPRPAAGQVYPHVPVPHKGQVEQIRLLPLLLYLVLWVNGLHLFFLKEQYKCKDLKSFIRTWYLM